PPPPPRKTGGRVSRSPPPARAQMARFVSLRWPPPFPRRQTSSQKPATPTGATAGGRSMIPGSFAYHRPKSVAEAVGMLADLGEEARPLAGGHSLIPMMKLRLAPPDHPVDPAGLRALKALRAHAHH